MFQNKYRVVLYLIRSIYIVTSAIGIKTRCIIFDLFSYFRAFSNIFLNKLTALFWTYLGILIIEGPRK